MSIRAAHLISPDEEVFKKIPKKLQGAVLEGEGS